ncbi:enoyl-[acyl-carrier-protein] reductase, mitochondrial-like [Saccostrea echinata]|uniref:enoyl-[acyl-carrier-protein] reductase, mitochondrial-like n=1 Tax=Saccostrea echinata TaxID=191078 RepID=UPI002A7F40EF|nr:enoyl-[acyl-carrier-protein] reductase, mitochondrial-like [Saccostrea echinata]
MLLRILVPILNPLKNGGIRRTAHVFTRSASSLSSQAIMYSKQGDPNSVLYLENSQILPALKDNEVLVKMKMAPINPSDINMIEGTYHMLPELPAVCGNEGVGEVLEVGKGVSSFCPGDWVIPAGTGFGTWRTFAVSTQDMLRKVPNDVPAISAATIMVNPCTAYRMLKDFVCLHEGDIVIQNGANSAVGQSVIQIAKEWGYKTINVVRNRPDFDQLAEYLKGLGATHVVTEEFSRSHQMRDLIKSMPCPPKLAFNTVGGDSATNLLKHLDSKGVMVTYGGMSKKPVVVSTGALIFKRVRLTGYWNAKWVQENKENPELVRMFDDLFDLVRERKLLPPSSETFSLSDFKLAVKSSLEGYKGSKKIFLMDDSSS